MNLDLIGKTGLVTASSGGIGLEIARSLAAEGANVVINGRMQTSVDQAVADIRAGLPNAKLVPLVSDNGTAAGCDHTISQLPDVDILVKTSASMKLLGFLTKPMKRGIRCLRST